MQTTNAFRATDTATSAIRRKPKGVLTPTEWAELHDALTLALDALGDGPDCVNQAFLLNCFANQRIGQRITLGRLQKLGMAPISLGVQQ